jgi:hypothetical protein
MAEILEGAIMKPTWFHTPEIQKKALTARLASEKWKESRQKIVEIWKSPESKKRNLDARKKSSACKSATKKMIEVMMQSEKCKAGLKHHAGRKWHLRSPSNVEYHFLNLSEFIRTHSHLFDADDIPVKAHRGIQGLRPSDTRKRVSGTWKGWTWISFCEVFYNSGDDLLDRNVETK